jgi:hypothetical protein
MADALIILGLAYVGYYLNNDEKNINLKDNSIPKNQIPNQNDIYENTRLNKVLKDNENKAKKNYLKSQYPEKTGVVPNFYNQLNALLINDNNDIDQLEDDDIHDYDVFIGNKSTNIKSVEIDENSILNKLIDQNTEDYLSSDDYGKLSNSKSNRNVNLFDAAENVTKSNKQYIENFKNNINKEDSFLNQFEDLEYDNFGDPSAENDIHTQNKGKNKIIDVERSMALNGGWTYYDTDLNNNNMTYNIVDKNNFVHNNMVPYFTGKGGYGIDNENTNYEKQFKLELFSGSDSTYQNKKIQAPLFDPVPEKNHINQVTASTEELGERYITSVPRERRNELLSEPERIAPGVGIGADGSLPLGYHSDYRVLPKNVDQLRTVNNQKQTYEGRHVDGFKYNKPGLQSDIYTYKPQSYKETTNEDMIESLGAYRAQTIRDNYTLDSTLKDQTLTEYTGGAYRADHKLENNVPEYMREKIRQSAKQNFKMPKPLQKVAIGQQQYSDNNNNINSYAFADNERSTTQNNKYLGQIGHNTTGNYSMQQDQAKTTVKEQHLYSQHNYTTAAPNTTRNIVHNVNLLDTTMKEFMINNPQNHNITMNNNKTYSNLTDNAKTTIKESTIDMKESGNIVNQLLGIKLTPNDEIKTTLKDQMINNKINNIINGQVSKGTIYDTTPLSTTLKDQLANNKLNPLVTGQISRGTIYDTTPLETTLKDQFAQNKINNIINGQISKGTMYNDTLLATTLKDQMVNNKINHLVNGQISKGTIYDDTPLDNTLKETTIIGKQPINIQNNSMLKGSVFNPKDITRTTNKEQIINNKGHGSQIAPIVSASKVFNPNDILQTTLKEQTINTSANGMASHNQGVGYIANPMDAKTTLQEMVINNNYIAQINNGSNNNTGYVTNPMFAKTTLNEMTVNNNYISQATNGRNNNTGYISNPMFAKTTLGEMTIDNNYVSQLNNSRNNNTGYVTNPMTAKTTLNEMTIDNNYIAQANNGKHNNTGYVTNPMTAKTTLQEMLVNNNHIGGANPNRINNTSYMTNPMTAKTTLNEMMVDNKYISQAMLHNNKASGYQSNKMYAPNTQRQTTVQNGEIGHAYATDIKKATPYNDAYNAETNDVKEVIAKGRAPTTSNYNMIPNMENTNVRLHNTTFIERDHYSNNSMPTSIDQIIESNNYRQGEQSYSNNTYLQAEIRLDPELMNSLNTNPYAYKMNYYY